MSNLNTNNLKAQLSSLVRDPTAIQDKIIDLIEDSTEGEVRLVDPSNPVALFTEMLTTTTSIAIEDHHSTIRKLYPALGTDYSDLYRHMADRDHQGIFALPAEGNIVMILTKDELLSQAVDVPNSVIKQITIPKDTVFYANDIPVSITHPINIQVTPHGSVNVVWDGTWKDDYFPLTSNHVEYDWISVNGISHLKIIIPGKQFEVTSSEVALSKVNGYKGTFNFPDRFYMCRIYQRTGTGKWTPLSIAFNDTVFDRETPTALVTVGLNNLTVSIPQIYFRNGKLGDVIRVDVYSTKGKMETNLAALETTAFGATYLDRDNLDDGKYTTAILNISNGALAGNGFLSGGRDALPYNAVRERILRKSDSESTAFDLETYVKDRGFDISMKYDNLTSRTYLLTRDLPAPVPNEFFSNAGAVMSSIGFKLDNLAALGFDIKDHGNLKTILPSTVYRDTADGLVVVTDNELKNPNSVNVNTLIGKINSGGYLHSPFHYVIEDLNNEFTNRCYYLQSPTLIRRNFESFNPSTGLDVGINQIQLKAYDGGYQIIVQLRTNDAMKALPDDQVGLQLAFTPHTANRRSYMNGVLHTNYVDDERVYIFDLPTDYMVNNEDVIYFDNFKINASDGGSYGSELLQQFDLFFLVNGVSNNDTSTTEIDSLIATDMLPDNTLALTHETITVKFGNRLRPLEGRALTFRTETIYQRYSADVPAVYPEDQYQRDVNGLLDVALDNGDVTYTKIANAGDPILVGGQPTYAHRANDFVLDSNGDKILLNGPEVTRSIELILFNLMFKLSTNDEALAYGKTLPEALVSYVENSYHGIQTMLPPRTRAQIAPRTSLGFVDITVSNDNVIKVKSDMRFDVDVYMDGVTHADIASHETMRSYIKKAINESINAKTISTHAIERYIKELIAIEGIEVHVAPLTEAKLNVFSLINDDQSFSVAKTMTVLPSGEITPIDDININLLKHKA